MRLRSSSLAQWCILVAFLVWSGAGVCAPHAHLALELNRGICIDRQFRTMPPEPGMVVTADDMRLIASMGFDFVKVLVNPEPMQTEGRFDPSKMDYVQGLVRMADEARLPVVVCLHPEWEYKKHVLSDADAFAKYASFLETFARALASQWTPRQLALQLMTEPGANSMKWNELQPQLWQAARRAMPEHTLILAGDQVGKIDGLITTEPVDDPNVMYSFTFYDPFVFTLQGGEWLTPALWSHLGAIPYPSSPEILAERKRVILDRIPADHPDWRAAAEGMLNEYADARWDKDTMQRSVHRLVDWNNAHGGGLKIWCAEFGCYQRTVDPEDRYRFLKDLRDTFEENGIGWAYWSYNETFTVMKRECRPFGPARDQTPDKRMLDLLLGSGR